MAEVRSKKIKIVMLTSAILLIILVLGFTGGLNIASFQKNYTNSLISSYAVSGQETVRKIEYAVKYGKPLTNFFGIEELLSEKVKNSDYLEAVQVILPDGSILYDQNGTVQGQKLPQDIQQQINFQPDKGEDTFTSTLYGGKYHAIIPIRDAQAAWIGSLDLLFDERVISEHTAKYLNQLVRYLALLAALALLGLYFFVQKAPLVVDNKINKKYMLTGFIAILGVVQIIYSAINYQLFKQAYREIARETVAISAAIMQKDINYVINKGVPYSKLYDLESYMQRIVKGVPEIERINLVGADNQVLYTTAGSAISETTRDDLSTSLHLAKDSQNNSAKISVRISESYLNSKLQAVILDGLTVLVASLIIMVETTLFLLIFLNRWLQREKAPAQGGSSLFEPGIMRPLSFVLFFAVFMPSAFIPLLMKEIYQPFLGLPKNVVLGLPISMEMLAAGLATVVAGYLVDKYDWRKIFFTGLFVLAVGTALSGLAREPLLFILARGIVGIGYGCSAISLRSFINTLPGDEAKSQGFTAMTAGLYAGLLNGVVIGAMLADRMGYSQVFFVALAFMLLAVLFALAFFRDTALAGQACAPAKAVGQGSGGGLWSFFGNKQVLTFFLLIVFPLTVCSMFLDYYFPLFAESMGASTSNVGRAFMLNGLCIVYLGPLLGKYTSKYLSPGGSILLSGLIIILAFLLFSLKATLLTAFIVVVLLGVAESFGLLAQNNYFLRLEATQRVGSGKALGYYDNIRKMGQMSGPLLFGGVLAFGILGVGAIGVVSFVLLGLFWLTNRQRGGLSNKPDKGVGL